MKTKSFNTLKKCPQEKCGYRNNGCHACEECSARPNIIDENCDRCLSCAREEGVLRWDTDGVIISNMNEKEKEMLRAMLKEKLTMLEKEPEEPKKTIVLYIN